MLQRSVEAGRVKAQAIFASHCMQVADAYFPADAGRLVSSAVYSLEIKCVKSGLYKPLLYGNS